MSRLGLVALLMGSFTAFAEEDSPSHNSPHETKPRRQSADEQEQTQRRMRELAEENSRPNAKSSSKLREVPSLKSGKLPNHARPAKVPNLSIPGYTSAQTSVDLSKRKEPVDSKPKAFACFRGTIDTGTQKLILKRLTSLEEGGGEAAKSGELLKSEISSSSYNGDFVNISFTDENGTALPKMKLGAKCPFTMNLSDETAIHCGPDATADQALSTLTQLLQTQKESAPADNE